MDDKCFISLEYKCKNTGCHNCAYYEVLSRNFSISNYCHLLYWIFMGIPEFKEIFPRKRFIAWSLKARSEYVRNTRDIGQTVEGLDDI